MRATEEAEPASDGDPVPVAVVLGRSGSFPPVELITDALLAAGFALPAQAADRPLAVVQQVADLGPELVVLDISQAGSFGLRLVGVVRTIAPLAHIVVVVPLPTLAEQARLAGADAVVDADDVRALKAEVRRVAASRLLGTG